MSVELGFNTHGKGRVRLVKVTRRPCGTQSLQQYSVQILLEGDIMGDVFLTGNNEPVVATDTCKNTVYILAGQHNFESIEDFGLILVRHFLSEDPRFVNRVNVTISKDNWERVTTNDSKGRAAPHKHAFQRVGPHQYFTQVTGEKRPGKDVTLALKSGIRELQIVKTTQSGFEGYHRDKYTSLPESKDRLLGTSATAEWTVSPKALGRSKINFEKVIYT
jgi:urate oxidase